MYLRDESKDLPSIYIPQLKRTMSLAKNRELGD